jgi:hypothetical protein
MALDMMGFLIGRTMAQQAGLDAGGATRMGVLNSAFGATPVSAITVREMARKEVEAAPSAVAPVSASAPSTEPAVVVQPPPTTTPGTPTTTPGTPTTTPGTPTSPTDGVVAALFRLGERAVGALERIACDVDATRHLAEQAYSDYRHMQELLLNRLDEMKSSSSAPPPNGEQTTPTTSQ